MPHQSIQSCVHQFKFLLPVYNIHTFMHMHFITMGITNVSLEKYTVYYTVLHQQLEILVVN